LRDSSTKLVSHHEIYKMKSVDNEGPGSSNKLLANALGMKEST